jgi:hypothetical protein
MLDTPEWLEVTKRAAKLDPYVALIDICIAIPRLLERTDQLTRTNAPPEEFEKLITDSQKVADNAFDWFAQFESSGPLYTKIPVEQSEGWVKRFNDFTFDPVYKFKTFATFTTLINYWMAMLILRSNAFGVLRKMHKLEPKQLLMWDREMGGYADNICRAVPYGCRPSAGYSGRFGSLTPLIVAKKYYDAKKATKEAEWCEQVYCGTRVEELYTPPVSMEPNPGLVNLVQNSSRYVL